MKKRNSISALIILVLINVIIASGLFFAFSKESFKSIPKFNCVSYTATSPQPSLMSPFPMADKNNPVSEDKIKRELLFLKPYTNCVRVYSTLYGMASVPKIALELGMTVVQGVWLGRDEARNQREVVGLKEILKTPAASAIQFIVMGNEALFFDDITVDYLIKTISSIRKITKIPVTTAEMEAMWENRPQLVASVDVIGVHAFPYWQSSYQVDPVVFPLSAVARLEGAYPGKQVILLETGWPSSGSPRKNEDIVNVSTQRQFYVDFTSLVAKTGLWYNMVEAFDQPWKIKTQEGRVGPHWGIFNAVGGDKVADTIYLQNKFILFSFIFSFILSVFIIYRFRTCRKIIGHIVSGVFAISASYLFVWVILQSQAAYITNLYFFVIIIPAAFFLIYTLSIHVMQAAFVAGQSDKLGGSVIGKEFSFVQSTRKVSIHIPCRNEDPKQVINLIKSCLNQTYKNFEIIIIDNNTSDINLWQPVKVFSDLNNLQVKFFHYEALVGFKAGALNMALKHTASDASVVAVLDADYEVSSEWLEKTLPYLNNKTVVVQAPQDHRVVSGSLFERLSILEAKVFFEVGMKIRALDNAIIQHGTMCLIDKKALIDVGGWSVQSIVEDADLGLRLFERGFNAVYVPVVLGSGIAPQNFSELTRQRFRWVYGSVQILKQYFKFFFWRSGLSLKQRFNFISGWIFWWLHILYPVFVVISVFATYLILKEIRNLPVSELSYLLFFYLIWMVIVSLVFYRKFLRATFKELFLLLIFGASLTHTLVSAVAFGLVSSNYPFLNTRKKDTLAQKIKDRRQLIVSSALVIFIVVQILSIYFTYGFQKGDMLLWQLTLVLISLPSIAVIVIVFISHLSRDVVVVRE